MTRAAKLCISVAVVAIIMLAGHTAASAQCPPGWTQKTQGITWGGCLFEATFCVSPTTPVQIIILKVRSIVPCGNGTPNDLFNIAEQGIIAAEIGLGGEDPDHFRCFAPPPPGVFYTITRSLCHEDRGPALGYFACSGTCTKTYRVHCDIPTGKLIFTLVAGPTANGSCDPMPVPCTTSIPCN